MSGIKRHIAAAVITLMTAAFSCGAIPQKPVPQRLVNDYAGLFSTMQKYALEAALVEFDDSKSNQIAVITVPDLEGMAPSDYATRIGLDWKVGSSDFNNGIVVLVKPKTDDSKGEVAISVGYGLEGAIPDVYCKRIIDNEMIPAFRENDYYTGVKNACEVLMKLASGEISEPREKDAEDAFEFIGGIITVVIFIVIILFIFGRGNGNNSGGNGHRRQKDGPSVADAILLGSLLNGGKSGGFGKGPFGGGSSGGGFGGFGGGSFGGGGASGSW